MRLESMRIVRDALRQIWVTCCKKCPNMRYESKRSPCFNDIAALFEALDDYPLLRDVIVRVRHGCSKVPPELVSCSETVLLLMALEALCVLWSKPRKKSSSTKPISDFLTAVKPFFDDNFVSIKDYPGLTTVLKRFAKERLFRIHHPPS